MLPITMPTILLERKNGEKYDYVDEVHVLFNLDDIGRLYGSGHYKVYYINSNSVILSIKELTVEDSQACVCDVKVIMTSGCLCGGV